MILRYYQQRAIDCLYDWWMAHPGAHEAPLLVLPTGAGKSVVIAELTRLLFDTWPEAHPRTVVLVPSKELAEQNADKLARLMPSHISLGYYSASLGRKRADADVIVATIGSIYKDAHLLGNIKCVIIDEAHLVNPDGKVRERPERPAKAAPASGTPRSNGGGTSAYGTLRPRAITQLRGIDRFRPARLYLKPSANALGKPTNWALRPT